MYSLNLFVVSGSDAISHKSKEILLKFIVSYFSDHGAQVKILNIDACITQIYYAKSVNLEPLLGTHRLVRYADVGGRIIRTTSFVSVTLDVETAFDGYPFRTWTN